MGERKQSCLLPCPMLRSPGQMASPLQKGCSGAQARGYKRHKSTTSLPNELPVCKTPELALLLATTQPFSSQANGKATARER